MAYNEDRNPFFNVRREKMTTESGIVLDKEALVNEDTNDVLGIVSPGYELVMNEEVDEIFSEAMQAFDVKETQDHLDAETKRWKRRVIFGDDRLTTEVAPGDATGVMLEIHNGYNGKTAFGYELMGFRWLCTNGMVMGKSSLFKESFAHFVNNPEKLRDSFEMKFDAFHKNAEIWKDWSKRPMSQGQFEEFVTGHTKPDDGSKAKKTQYLGTKVAKSIIDSYESLLIEQKLDDTMWGAFNVLTYLSTHTAKARRGSNVFSQRHKTLNRLAGDLYGVTTDSMTVV